MVVVDPARVRCEQLAKTYVVERVLAGCAARAVEDDSVTLCPQECGVKLEYTALIFLEPSNVRFRYRLEPYDADWVDAGNRRTAFNTEVPPGRLVLVDDEPRGDMPHGWRV